MRRTYRTFEDISFVVEFSRDASDFSCSMVIDKVIFDDKGGIFREGCGAVRDWAWYTMACWLSSSR